MPKKNSNASWRSVVIGMIDKVYTVMYFSIAERTFSMKATASSWTAHTSIQVRIKHSKGTHDQRSKAQINSLQIYLILLIEEVGDSTSPGYSSLRSLCSHQEVLVWTCWAHSVRPCRASGKHHNRVTKSAGAYKEFLGQKKKVSRILISFWVSSYSCFLIFRL
jgi:hypothetical protein